MGISVRKTKVMVFRPPNSPRPFNKIDLVINGDIVEMVNDKRILGKVLDTNLLFDKLPGS